MGIFVSKCRTHLSPAETDYLYKSMLRFPDKLARFRMSLKAHKNPWKMRPIVCCAGTFINCLSKWLDYWLQQLKPLLTCYIKNSSQLLNNLSNLGTLPPNARLFTADAVSMYTNIDTDNAIEVISNWLDSLGAQLPDKSPPNAVKEAMSLVMKKKSNLATYTFYSLLEQQWVHQQRACGPP